MAKDALRPTLSEAPSSAVAVSGPLAAPPPPLTGVAGRSYAFTIGGEETGRRLVRDVAPSPDVEDQMDRKFSVDVRLLGGFELRVDDRLVPATVWRQRRAAAIVKLLALEPGHRLHREQLLESLWPDLDSENAANNLRVALHHARLGLETAGAPAGVFLVREGDSLVLGPREAVEVDVTRFDRAVARAWQSADPAIAERAASLYRGDLLPDDPYEEWAAARREALRASYLTLLARVSGLHEARGDFARAVVARERVLAADPLDEAAHAALMRLHARMGNADLALAHYARFARLLERELGAAPEPEIQELAAAIRDGRMTPLPTPPAPPADVSVAATARLPAAVDILVGRERELAELQRLLTGARLVTLTGPGGIGKTRLAMETARAAETRYADGVALVDLASLRDAALVLPTVARTLGVEEAAGQPVEELLATAIDERHLLLVLDNLEQVVAAAPGIANLLATCPTLTILATSRVRLRLRGEQEYPVSPLSLPERSQAGRDVLLPDLEHAPAVALFTRRAQAARPSFRLTADNVDSVVAVCRQLDGLPLAIELAAARVRVLAPDQLLRRMARPLDVLGMTAADLPARQRTLRDTISWSHDLLAPDEQMLFRRLSVFAGSWTLEGAEAVAAIAGETPLDAIETLAGLIDQSLINTRQGPDDTETCYTMLETIREFAVERLAASGEIVPVERAFESFLIRLAERAEEGLRGPDQLQWLDRLEDEHDNIRAALGRMLDREDSQAALSLAPRLWEFWRIRGYSIEGHGWLERVLAFSTDAAPSHRAATEYALGKLSVDMGDYEAAEHYFQTSADIWHGLGDREALVKAKNSLVTVKLNVGDLAEAKVLGEETLAISRELGDALGTATALLNLGMLAREGGEFHEAVEMLEESLAIVRQLGDLNWVALTALNLASAYYLGGNPEPAQRLLEECNRLYEQLGDRFHLAVIAHNRGHIERESGRTERANVFYAEALQHFESVGVAEGVIESIEWIAVTAVQRNLMLPALHLLGATAAARQARRLPPLAADARVMAASQDTAAQSIGHDLAENALAAGAAYTLEQARDAALDITRGATISIGSS